MHKILINIIIQIAAIFFVSKYFIFNNLNSDKLALILSPKVLMLLLLLFLLKLLIAYLFLIILNIISSKNNNYFNVADIFLQGGIINQILPGLGYFYRYYKFKTNSQISLIEYSISQTAWSLNSLFAYLFLALISGFILISSVSSINLFLFIFLLLSFLLIMYIFNEKNYIFFRKYLLKINKINSLYVEIKKIKNIIKLNIKKFLYIFFGFIILAVLECFAFYITLNMFGANISFMASNYTFIAASLTSILILIKYFGVFELMLAISASFIMPDFNDMIFYGALYRIINTCALIFATVFSAIINFVKAFRNRY